MSNLYVSTPIDDPFLSTEQTEKDVQYPPFQFREDPESEEETLKWLNQNFETQYRSAQSRLNTYRHNIAMFKGLQWEQDRVSSIGRDGSKFSRNPRQIYNFFKEMTDARTAQMLRLKANIAVTPMGDSQDEINDAVAAKAFLDNRMYEVKFTSKILQPAIELSYLTGDSFLYIHYDPRLGATDSRFASLRPESQNKLRKKFQLVPKVGDVGYKVLGPDRVIKEHGAECWENTDYVDLIMWEYPEKLKAMYPNSDDKVPEECKYEMYDYETGEFIKPKGKVMYKVFYHRPTDYTAGCRIVYTREGILEWTKVYPYNHGKLPLVKRSDISVYGEFWGRSFLLDIDRLQKFYNGLQSNIGRDIALGAAPKWAIPKGSVNLVSINNEFSVMEYKGVQRPELITKNPTAPQNMELQDRTERQISKASKVYDISRGEVPSGITANSALQFLDEQEQETLIAEQLKQKDYVVEIYQMTLEVMRQYYKETDKRVARVLGNGNEFQFKSFKKSNFMNAGDVFIENTSALPDSKAGRLAAIIDINTSTQTDPVFRREEVVDLLGIANDKIMRDRATVALTSARSALQKIMEGEKVVEPKPFDNLLVHYDVFVREMESTNFKSRVSPEIADKIAIYIMTLEGLMYYRATKNTKFLGELLNRSEYPIFFETPQPLNQLAQQMTAQPTPEGAVRTDKMKLTQEALGQELNR